MQKLIPFVIYFCHLIAVPAQKIWYVNDAAVGTNNGNNWEDAFVNLQSALNLAIYGDQVWVAQGTYLPTEDANREVSFNLPPGVQLYGGFLGNEQFLNQRNINLYITTLSGEIGFVEDRKDNSYHVVKIYGGDENTILDGFKITKGYAANSFSNFPDEYGGGVLVVADAVWPQVSPVIAHCKFEENRAGSGGGLASVSIDGAVCSPEIRHCTFTRNRGEYQGGALCKIGRNRNDRAFTVYNCKFEDNYCFQFSGGIAIINPSDTVRIVKCKFIRDSSRVESGGIYFESEEQNVRYEIDSCEFIANYSFINGGAISHVFPGFSPLQKIELVVKHSIFLLNHTFSGNSAAFASIALFNLELHHIQVEACHFESNFAQNGGAGIFIQGGSGVNTEASVDRCWFLGNQTGSSSVAGAFYYRGFGSALIRNQNTITNSVFMFNDGAIASLGGNPGITHTRVANCSFYKNGDIPFVKYWGPDNNPVDLVMKMQILNSVIWEPQTEGVHRLFYNNDPVDFTVNDYLVEYSVVNLADCSYNGIDPCGEGMIYETWPDFIDPEFGNTLDIWRCSPAQNQGSNIVVDTFGLVEDYWGLPRIIGDTVDIGAYEIQTLCISGTETLPFFSLPVGIRILQNPILKGEPIKIELFAAVHESLHFQLIEANGRVVWEGSTLIPASTPSVFSIPSNSLNSGLYFLKVMDQRGRSKTEKVVISL